MPEQIQKMIDRVLEWWKKFSTTQKVILISATSVVIVALGILCAVVAQPKYVPLYTASSTKEAAAVKGILDGDSSIKYQISEDGLVFTVDEKSMSTANLLLGENGYPSEGYSLDNVFSGGWSSTEADKNKKYKEFLQDALEKDIESLDIVDDAIVSMDIPKDDGTILSTEKNTYVGVMLNLNDVMSDDQAYALAKLIATNVGNDTTDNITLMDFDCNVLYAGSDSSTAAGAASTQLSYKQKLQSSMETKVKNALAKSKTFTDIEVALNLDVDFSTVDVIDHSFTPQEGSDKGLINNISTYESNSTNGTAGVPGTDSNDDTSYMTQDYDVSESSISESKIQYDNNERIETTHNDGGTINYENSSISIVTYRYVKYDEALLKASGELGEQSFDEYMAERSTPVLTDVDDSWISVVANATGIASSKISIVCYEVALPVPEETTGFSLEDILQIALAVLIFLLLGYVVFRSTRRTAEEETEPELSVENLLESTAESQENLEDIGYNEKSETRILIEKFVDENPDAVALLLRNWLNEEWE